jgi:tetratricopeptide (TPR) repeat protein
MRPPREEAVLPVTRVRRSAAILVCLSAAWSLAFAAPIPAYGSSAAPVSSSVEESELKTNDGQANALKELKRDTEDLKERTTWILYPISILLAVLTLGGGLSVVFSIRDQSRIRQLHELTVSGAVASQRRDEQSYASFLDQSQTTLALVNDTLKLAKEATDQAAHSMDIKAQARIDSIEERAQKLMLDVISGGEFELILTDAPRRGELHAIADELRSLEGYLSLQDIELPEFTKFVQAIDQFLVDDTESALQVLRLSSQERVAGGLHRFIEYWLGYMLTTVGLYEEAIGMFRDDETDLNKDNAEYFQLERIIVETEFFQLAKQISQDETSGGAKGAPVGPHQRFKRVARLLDRLSKLARHLHESEDHRAEIDTSLEVARTRADIYEWIAYDPRHLDDPLRKGPVRAARKMTGKTVKVVGARRFLKSSTWEKLEDEDTLRAWALMQAQVICERENKRSFDVEFALAECLFKLRDKRAEAAFEKAEHMLHDQFGGFREKRRNASLQQSLVICHSRLLRLRRNKARQRRAETRLIRQAARHAQEAVNEMRQGRVTVFSQIQRRNISQAEFKTEIQAIVKQDRLKEKDE